MSIFGMLVPFTHLLSVLWFHMTFELVERVLDDSFYRRVLLNLYR